MHGSEEVEGNGKGTRKEGGVISPSDHLDEHQLIEHGDELVPAGNDEPVVAVLVPVLVAVVRAREKKVESRVCCNIRIRGRRRDLQHPSADRGCVSITELVDVYSRTE